MVRQVVVRQHHAAESDKINLPGPHVVLRHVRQPFLQIAVTGSYNRHPRIARLDLASHRNEPRDAGSRGFWWIVTIARRKQRRSLDGRVVVAASAWYAHPLNSHIFVQIKKFISLRQDDSQ